MKPSWVLSEDERQRRFRKNRERGPSDQTGQSSQGMERSEDYKAEPQELPQTSPEQNLPVVKKENANSLIEQTKVETIPMSSLSFRDGSFQQPLMVKSECGESSFLALAPGPAPTTSSSGPSYLALAPPPGFSDSESNHSMSDTDSLGSEPGSFNRYSADS